MVSVCIACCVSLVWFLSQEPLREPESQAAGQPAENTAEEPATAAPTKPKSTAQDSAKPSEVSTGPTATQPISELETGHTYSVLGWNVESGGNDPQVIAQELKELAGYDFYCLCEVHADNFERYAAALPDRFVSVPSKTGGGDRMQIAFDGDRFEPLDVKELREFNEGRHQQRAPLLVRLRDRRSDTEFVVMVNHLAREDDKLRVRQAIGLRGWARDQSVGVINIGDFNMDYNFKTQKGNEALPEMLRDNIWAWVQPEEWIDTQWDDDDGKDRYPNSMLDFAFVSGPAKTWNPQCRVIVREGDFPDTAKTSDHRPIELRLTLPK